MVNLNQFKSHYQRSEGHLLKTQEFVEFKLKSIFAESPISIHSINSRIKSWTALKEKVLRPDKTYSSLSDIHDLLGFRVITYFEDQTLEVAKTIELNFKVDFSHSVDKKELLGSGQFGYRSLHYVCTLLPEDRERLSSNLHEDGPFQFEIQIRSILQHAWAEIEHDLGYKTLQEIPSPVRRKFSRLAGLLEVADDQFVSLRNELKIYEKNWQEDHLEREENESLDVIGLKQFIQKGIILQIDRDICNKFNKEISSSPFYPDYLLKMLNLSGIYTWEELIDSLRRLGNFILSFTSYYFEFANKTWNFNLMNFPSFHKGYSLLFLAHLEILFKEELELHKFEKLESFFRRIDFNVGSKESRIAAQNLLDEFNRFLKREENSFNELTNH